VGDHQSALKKEKYRFGKSIKSLKKRKENCMKTVRRSRLKVRYQLVTVTRCTISEIRGAESASAEPEETSVQAISIGQRNVRVKDTKIAVASLSNTN